MKCQFVSTRSLGTLAVAPGFAKPVTPINGKPPLNALTPVSRPIELGRKLWSCGKKPSANRFQPSRASFTWDEFTTLTYDRDTNCTRVGVVVLKPGSNPPASCAKGKLWVLSPK